MLKLFKIYGKNYLKEFIKLKNLTRDKLYSREST